MEPWGLDVSITQEALNRLRQVLQIMQAEPSMQALQM